MQSSLLKIKKFIFFLFILPQRGSYASMKILPGELNWVVWIKLTQPLLIYVLSLLPPWAKQQVIYTLKKKKQILICI